MFMFAALCELSTSPAEAKEGKLQPARLVCPVLRAATKTKRNPLFYTTGKYVAVWYNRISTSTNGNIRLLADRKEAFLTVFRSVFVTGIHFPDFKISDTTTKILFAYPK